MTLAFRDCLVDQGGDFTLAADFAIPRGARVAVSQAAVPAELEDSRRRIEALEAERSLLAREARLGGDVGRRLTELEAAVRRASARGVLIVAGSWIWTRAE